MLILQETPSKSLRANGKDGNPIEEVWRMKAMLHNLPIKRLESNVRRSILEA